MSHHQYGCLADGRQERQKLAMGRYLFSGNAGDGLRLAKAIAISPGVM